MDLDTENKLAALLMEEARRLRTEADREGVHAYLRQPKARGRPNSRFLTATVLGVQQANKLIEVDEMWRAREKELELMNRSKSKATVRGEMHHDYLLEERQGLRNENAAEICDSVPSSSRSEPEYYFCTEEDDLRDDDIEKFLHSRAKRGRGGVGSRMDEPDARPACSPSVNEGNMVASTDLRVQEEWEQWVIRPQQQPSFKSHESTKYFVCNLNKVSKKCSSKPKKRRHDKKHRLKEGHSKNKRKEKRSRHHGSP